MKRVAMVCLVSGVFAGSLSAGETINKTLVHDGRTRTYQVYVPDAYTGIEPWPVVLNFHGSGLNGALLRRGMGRLSKVYGVLPPQVVLMPADANALPFRVSSIATVVCHGAFHVFSNPSAVCAEWARVLHPGGQLHVSSLVLGRWLGDRYLDLLHRAGEVTRPRTPSEFARLIETEMSASARLEVVGNFAYLSLTK